MSDAVYARSSAIKIEVKEEYAYALEMDSSPVMRAGSPPPSGRIDVFVPLDRTFPYRRALDPPGSLPPAGITARMGSIFFQPANPAPGTPAQELFEINHGLPAEGVQRRVSPLLYGTRTYPVEQPGVAPWQFPVEALVNVYDEFTQEHAALARQPVEGTGERGALVQFERELVLDFRLRVAVPVTQGRGSAPVLKTAHLQWPAATSYQSLSLTNNDKEHALRYIAREGSLEWGQVPFRMVRRGELSATERSLYVYAIDRLLLRLHEPGAFSREARPIRCNLEIELPNRLFSGTQVEYIDAAGQMAPVENRRVVERSSILKVQMDIDLYARFQQRILAPVYQLYFEGLTLRQEQVEAMRGILRDHGFREVITTRDDALPLDPKKPRAELVFTRQSGLDTARLWLRAECTVTRTARQTIVPGGKTYTTPVESGNTRVTLRSELRGDTSGLTSLLNNIHKALEERFRYLTPPD